ncbi:MAG: CoA pyrophosphatase [Actinomycetota bacterium]
MHATDVRDRLRGALDPDPAIDLEPHERVAAVLVPVIEAPEPAIVFTLRAAHLSRHAGEISFPGGVQEPGEALVDTALREASEEIGLDPLAPEVLGALAPIHTRVSGFLVVPWVGVLSRSPVLAASDHEIEAIVELPIARLDAAERPMELPVDGGRTWTGWAYQVDGTTVWGATGWILHRFLELVRRETRWLTT